MVPDDLLRNEQQCAMQVSRVHTVIHNYAACFLLQMFQYQDLHLHKNLFVRESTHYNPTDHFSTDGSTTGVSASALSVTRVGHPARPTPCCILSHCFK